MYTDFYVCLKNYLPLRIEESATAKIRVIVFSRVKNLLRFGFFSFGLLPSFMTHPPLVCHHWLVWLYEMI